MPLPPGPGYATMTTSRTSNPTAKPMSNPTSHPRATRGTEEQRARAACPRGFDGVSGDLRVPTLEEAEGAAQKREDGARARGVDLGHHAQSRRQTSGTVMPFPAPTPDYRGMLTSRSAQCRIVARDSFPARGEERGSSHRHRSRLWKESARE